MVPGSDNLFSGAYGRFFMLIFGRRRAASRLCWAAFFFVLLPAVLGHGATVLAQTDPRGWPPGLSAEARQTIRAFEAGIIEAGRETGIEPRRMATEFIGEVAKRVAQETLAKNWPAVKEFADRSLAALPGVAAEGLAAREAVAVFPPPEAQAEYDRALAFVLNQEASLAGVRAWNPEVVASTAASQVLGLALTPEDFGRHSIVSGLVSRGLARTTWKGEAALISAQGAWTVVSTYQRTRNGLFVVKRSWLFPRQGAGADPFE